MLKWVLVVVVVVAVVMWLRMAARPSGSQPPAGSRADGASRKPKPVVACAHCGLNLPRDEAVAVGERWYCCEEHRALAHDR